MPKRKARLKSLVSSSKYQIESIAMTYIDSWIKEVLDTESSDLEALKNRIAQKIEALIERNEMSRAEFAKQLGVSAPYVTKLLRGDSNPSLKTLVKVARACDAEIQIDFIPEDSGCSDHVWEQLHKQKSERGEAFKLSGTDQWYNHSFLAGE